MHKMRGRGLDDSGSATVEISLIIPIVICIVFMLIGLFLDGIQEGIIYKEGYTNVYTFSQFDTDKTIQSCEFEARSLLCNDGNVTFTFDDFSFTTEYLLCTPRLRRWQLYGDILCE